MKSHLTPKQEQYILDNYQNMSRRKMAEALGLKSRASISTFMKRNKLSVSKEQSNKFRTEATKGRTTFTAAEDNYIKENYLSMPVRILAKNINRSGFGVRARIKVLGLVIPPEIIEKRKSDSYYKKGQTAPNKGKKQSDYMSAEAIEKTKTTRFKKGQIPHNYNGGEHLSKDGYIIKSVGEGKTVLKHHWEWIQEHGEIPKSYILKCLTEDKTNTHPSNWKLMTMTENMIRNSKNKPPEELVQTMVLRSQLKKKIRNHENN